MKRRVILHICKIRIAVSSPNPVIIVFVAFSSLYFIDITIASIDVVHFIHKRRRKTNAIVDPFVCRDFQPVYGPIAVVIPISLHIIVVLLVNFGVPNKTKDEKNKRRLEEKREKSLSSHYHYQAENIQITSFLLNHH